jgi:hypothetical protein
MTAAGHAAPPLADGLGFWNRPTGLVLLGVRLQASLTIRHRGGEAAAILVMRPVGVGRVLRRSWHRRRPVMRAVRHSLSASS